MDNKQKLIEIVGAFSPKGHFELDEDCFFSCPMSDTYCGGDTECNCGYDFQRKQIDEALRLIELL